jgi:choline kinase/mannose-6-phosphate isomerase-like protein (cupin superfamily)/thiamine kinase-like enzyme
MVKIITKPWGKEEWLELNDQYCYKRIYINAGYKTSYQYHNIKRETCYLISGEAEIWLENDNGIVEKRKMKEGDFYNVQPTRKHRVIAITDIILQEVSTPEVDDVIRIEDDARRNDGKIESEDSNPAVLILSAGTGSRLGNLTQEINKVLLPINNKAIISHIITYFPNDYDFIITKGYKGDSIEEYCKIVYPNHKFTFVEIDKFIGEDTGPGYSALQCKKFLQRPFYLIVGDCLLDSPIPHIDSNWMGVSPTLHPEKYATVNIDKGENVITMKNKNNEGYDSAFIGLCGILNFDIFWGELEKNIKKGELVCAFENPSLYPTLKVKRVTWLDTGNLNDLEKTRKYLNDRPLSLTKTTHEFTYKDNGKFLKFVPDEKLLSNRVARGKCLKSLIPKNFGYTSKFMYYDWVSGRTIYEVDDINVFIKFLDFFKRNLESTIEGSSEAIKKFYEDKTIERLNMFINNKRENYFTESYEINGVKYPPMKSLYLRIPITSVLKMNPFYSLCHGDLHFENTLYTDISNEFVYIDWRDSFGGRIDGGDVYYDMAKFYGGLLIPYNLMKNENEIFLEEDFYKVTYHYTLSENLCTFKPIYEKWIIENGYNLDKVKLITGLIFLNMSPLHDEVFSKLLWFKSIEMLYGSYK